MRIPTLDVLQSVFGKISPDQAIKGYLESLGDSVLSKEAILNGAILHCEEHGISNVYSSSTYGILRLIAQNQEFYSGTCAPLTEEEVSYVGGRNGTWNGETTFKEVVLYIVAHY